MAKQSAMDKVFNGLLKEAQNILEGGGSAEQRNTKAVKFLKLAQQARKLDDGDIEEETTALAKREKPAQAAAGATPPKQEPKVEAPKADPVIAAAAVANGSANASPAPEKRSMFGR